MGVAHPDRFNQISERASPALKQSRGANCPMDLARVRLLVLHDAEDDIRSNGKTDRRCHAAEGDMLERRVPKCDCKSMSLMAE